MLKMTKKPPKSGGKSFLQGLIAGTGYIFHHIGHFAAQNAAKIIDGGGVQGAIVAEFVDGGTGDAMIFDQGVGGLAGGMKRAPKWLVRNQNCHLPPNMGISYGVIAILTIVGKKTII